MPWYQIQPNRSVSDIRSSVIERYETGQYALYQDGSQWQIIYQREDGLCWPADQEMKYVELDPDRLRQIRNRCRPHQRRSSGNPPIDIVALLRRYVSSQDSGLAATRLELSQARPTTIERRRDTRTVAASDSTDFFRDFERLEKHLWDICTKLEELDWSAQRLDQFCLKDLGTDYPQTRWLPNLVIWRANEVFFVEGRSGDDFCPGYSRIDTSLSEAARSFIDYTKLPMIYVFGDFRCMTPAMFQELREELH
jgi:hypothetical protein